MNTAAKRRPAGSDETVHGGADPPGSSLGPVQSLTRHAAVADALRRAILAGELAPGERLRELRLANSLGVSRPTLREAIQELVYEGILVQEPYKGVRVVEVDPSAIRDISSVRTGLETLAAVRTSQDATGRAIGTLQASLATYISAFEQRDPSVVLSAHLALHGSIWMNCGSPILARLWPIVAAPISIAITLDEAFHQDPEREKGLHLALVEVIASGGEDAIAQEVARHVQESAEELIQRAEKH